MIGNDGVRAYLGAVVSRTKDAIECGISHTVSDLAEEVIDLYNRRQLAEAAEKIRALAASPPGAIETSDLQRRIEEVAISLPSATRQNTIETAGEIAMTTMAHAERIFESGETPGIYSGFEPFDRLVGPMVAGDMIVIGGATSMGKTALSQQIAFMVAQEYPVLCMSLEMSKTQWNNRYITQLTGIPSDRLEMGPFSDRDFELIDMAWRDSLRHLKMVIGGVAGMTVGQIAAFARRVKRRFGLRLLVIDHLGFIGHPNPAVTGPERLANITLDIKAIAHALEVPVLLASHINREGAKRDNYRPVLSDLFGSSAIEKDADVVMFVHRLEYWLRRKGPEMGQDRDYWEADMRAIERDAEFILAKRRRGHGAGIVDVEWVPDKTLFRPRI